METLVKIVGVIVLLVVFIAGFALLMALPTMWIINYLFTPSAITAVFGTSAIGFWKAFWLNFFFGIAFKSSSSSSKSD